MRITDAMLHNSEETGLNPKTITLSGRELRAATRLLSLLLDGEGSSSAGSGRAHIEPNGNTVEPNCNVDRAILVERARREFVGRQRRSQFFSSAMFGEPAWDMLLALYVIEQSGPRHTIVKLVAQAAAPATTALRWLEYLDKERLVVRHSNPIDRRTTFIEISDKARLALDAYYSGTVLTDI
jgi:DNA-binding MarR family transcriptional regulator